MERGNAFTARIRYSEIDENELLKADVLADYFQDVAIYHDLDCGLGRRYWAARDAHWVITTWKVLIFRRPSLCEPVRTKTWATNLRNFTAIRNYSMRDMDGRMLAAAVSKWGLITNSTGLPAKISKEEAAKYGIEEALPIVHEPDRIRIPDLSLAGEPIRITREHTDANHHVNNVRYISLAMQSLPDGFEIRTLRAAYHKPAFIGDVLIPVFEHGQGTMSGGFVNEKGESYAVFEFSEEIAEEDRKVALL